MAEAMNIPASQDSQVGEECWRCNNFVADGEECECEHIACKCDHIVEQKNYLGECVGCEKHLATCCGVLTEDQDPICHPPTGRAPRGPAPRPCPLRVRLGCGAPAWRARRRGDAPGHCV